MDLFEVQAAIMLRMNPSSVKTKRETSLQEHFEHSVKEIETEEILNCPVCRSSDFEKFTSGFDYEFQTCNNLWHFVRCKNCSHVWLNPRPSLLSLGVIYPKGYDAYPFVKRINPIASFGKEILDWFKLQSVLKYCKKLNTYLDIGCSSGRFLKLIKKKGLPGNKIFGVDFNEKSLKPLREAGFNVFATRIENCTELPNDSIDLATMFHIIEHLGDPKSVIKKVRNWLSSGGVLVIETPNLESIDARIFKSRYWGGYHIPRHWNLFTKETLEKLLTEEGFEILSTRFLPRPYTYMMSFYNYLKYSRDLKTKLAIFFDPFSWIGLPQLVMFTLLDKISALLGFESSTILMVARKNK